MSLLDSVDEKYPQPFSTDAAFKNFVDSRCEHLADGTSRSVYCVVGEEFVIKMAIDDSKIHCNWLELAAWLFHCKDRPQLARIVSCSHSGRYIVMEKLDADGERPDDFSTPHWVTDAGSKNGGVDDDGKYKLFDYAFVKSPDEGYKPRF